MRPFAFVPALLLAACSDPSGSFEETIPDGTLRGLSYTETAVFRGVPFAAPPLGERRLRPPVQNAPYPAGRDAIASAPGCLQFQGAASSELDTSSSEDCLYLDLWVPRRAGPHPVLVFFHGGAYVFGKASEPTYDGRKLSEAGQVIVVSASYRLGPLGFLAHAALRDEDPTHPTSGDYGLDDQREALRWVQRNIAAFGGDPSRVTVFGESAGAGSICAHLVSPRSAGLYAGAILESPPCTGTPWIERDAAEAQGAELTRALGCGGDGAAMRACLREANGEAILRALPLKPYVVYGPGVAWGPIVDGVNLAAQPSALFARGQSADVPIIVGANADEGSLFFEENDGIHTEADLRALLAEMFRPSEVDAIVAHYPIASSAKDTATHILGDIFVCDARRVARDHAAAGHPAYRYYFARGFYDLVLDLGAFHGAELPFVFGNALKGLPVLPLGAPLRDAMQGYWTSLARAGDPNGADRPGWPRYEAATDRTLRLDVPIKEETGLRATDCDFWDRLRAE